MRKLPTVFSFISLLVCLLISEGAWAEYRVFDLEITNTETGQTRNVLSTLDDIQYPGYYPLRAQETIRISDTWMCWKRSDHFQRYCPNPNNTDLNRAPAAQGAQP